MTSGIDRLFGSKTRVILLTRLLMNSDKRFYIRELSRDLGIPYSMLYKEAHNLRDLGIIEEEARGKVTLLSVNKNLPYFAELKGMLIKTAGLGYLMKDAFEGLTGIKYALIYGSFAKGTERVGSDIDLLVIGSVDEDALLKAVSKVQTDIGREINYILWTEKEFLEKARSRIPLVREISRTSVIMIAGEENEFKRTVKKGTH